MSEGERILNLIDRLRAQQDQRAEAAVRYWSENADASGRAAILSACEAVTLNDVPPHHAAAALELMRIGAMVVMTALAEREIEG